MHLRTLGGLKLEHSNFHRLKPLLLLTYLAVEGAKEKRHLQELFWPDAASPATSLRMALSQLRKADTGLFETDDLYIRATVESDVAGLLSAIQNRQLAQVNELYEAAFLENFSLPD